MLDDYDCKCDEVLEVELRRPNNLQRILAPLACWSLELKHPDFFILVTNGDFSGKDKIHCYRGSEENEEDHGH